MVDGEGVSSGLTLQPTVHNVGSGKKIFRTRIRKTYRFIDRGSTVASRVGYHKATQVEPPWSTSRSLVWSSVYVLRFGVIDPGDTL